MATFVKCKQESYSYDRYDSEWVKTGTKRFLLFFKRDVGGYRYVSSGSVKYYNHPVNLELVQSFTKYDREMEWNSPKSDKNEKKGIRFDLIDGEVIWYFDSEKTRNEQFEEIISNSHLYKSKVNI